MPKVLQSAFPVACFWGLSDIHENMQYNCLCEMYHLRLHEYMNNIICYCMYVAIAIFRTHFAGLAAIVTQIPLVDAFRWSGWYLAFHGTIQMLVVLVVFKENWSDLKRTSVSCKRLSILSGIAVPFYVSFNPSIKYVVSQLASYLYKNVHKTGPHIISVKLTLINTYV